MKVLYFYQYFSTPSGSWGTRVYEFAKKWVEKGCDVTVVTSVYSKSDIHAQSFLETQYFDGIRVKIINVKIDNKQSKLRRVYSWFVYLLFATFYSLTLSCDVIVASSGPITAFIPGLFAKFFRRKKMVLEVRDLWPAGAIEMGMIKNKLFQKVLFSFEGMCYNASDLIIALSPGMKANILSRYPKLNVHSIPNAANISLFSHVDLDSKKKFDSKYFIYTGNIGTINNSDFLYETAKFLKNMNRSDVLIVLVGDGPLKEELQRKSKEDEVQNFLILDLMPKVELVAYVQGALASIVPLKNKPILDTSSPNKLFESLAAGVPVIQTTQGWIKDMVSEYNVGFTVKSGDYESLANIMIDIYDGKVDLNQMKENAVSLATNHFDKDILADKMLQFMSDVL
ncbi:MAG: glycosyltransferase family 4 protein [Bacteroidales bacterium]|jgi:glycosyltransferase involved in cell wall biosynthesis|nr:glycosyltransferase family 4 protein [Bacteroidales bacterium]